MIASLIYKPFNYRNIYSAFSIMSRIILDLTERTDRCSEYNPYGDGSCFWRQVMDAEKEKRESEERHQLATTKCANCEKKLKQLEKKFSKSIQKAGYEKATI